MQELGSATDNPKSIPFLTNAVVVQVSGKKYDPTRARTKAFVVEAWRFSGEAKMLVSQNHTTRNYVNSITYQVKTDLIFTDTLSVKVTFQLIAFALPKIAVVFFDAIYQRSMINLESSPANMACSRAS